MTSTKALRLERTPQETAELATSYMKAAVIREFGDFDVQVSGVRFSNP